MCSIRIACECCRTSFRMQNTQSQWHARLALRSMLCQRILLRWKPRWWWQSLLASWSATTSRSHWNKSSIDRPLFFILSASQNSLTAYLAVSVPSVYVLPSIKQDYNCVCLLICYIRLLTFTIAKIVLTVVCQYYSLQNREFHVEFCCSFLLWNLLLPCSLSKLTRNMYWVIVLPLSPFLYLY